jgi:hypothetical protein
MSKATPTWARAIREAIDSALIDIHTAMVCCVQSYDPATQRADVSPQIKRPLESLDTGEIEHEELPVLPNIPVAFPRAGNFFMSFPLKKGDFVLVVFNEYSIDQWLEKGRATAPGDIGHLTMTGGIALPLGPYPTSLALDTAHADDAVIGEDDGTQVHIKPGGACEITSDGSASADDFVALSAKVDAILADVITLLTSWTVKAADGGLALQAAAKLLWPIPPGSVASTNLKAD